jgi:hypothetical protein
MMTGRVNPKIVAASHDARLRALAAIVQGGLWIPAGLPASAALTPFDHKPLTGFGFIFFGVA